MSKTRSSSGQPRTTVKGATNKPLAAAPAKFLPPLKPKKKAMVILGIVLAAWMIALLFMYFKTVYPTRHDDPRKAHEPTVLPVN